MPWRESFTGFKTRYTTRRNSGGHLAAIRGIFRGSRDAGQDGAAPGVASQGDAPHDSAQEDDTHENGAQENGVQEVGTQEVGTQQNGTQKDSAQGDPPQEDGTQEDPAQSNASQQSVTHGDTQGAAEPRNERKGFVQKARGVVAFVHRSFQLAKYYAFTDKYRRRGERMKEEEQNWLRSVPEDLAIDRPFHYREGPVGTRAARDGTDGTPKKCVACRKHMVEWAVCYLLACSCRMHRRCIGYLQETTGHFVCHTHEGRLKPRDDPPQGWQSIVTMEDKLEAKKFIEANWRAVRPPYQPEDTTDRKPRRLLIWGPATKNAAPLAYTRYPADDKWPENQPQAQPGTSFCSSSEVNGCVLNSV